MTNAHTAWRRLRLGVSALAVLSITVHPVAAAGKNDDACAAQRAPLVKLDKDYEQLKRSKLGAAIGQGLKQGAMVMAKGVASGGMGFPGIGRGGGSGFGGMGGLMGAVGGMAAQSAARQQAAQGGQVAALASPASMVFGQDMLTGAMGLNVPGLDTSAGGGGLGGGDSVKAYAALAVLVAIVATAEAYAQLKEQEAGGDLRKASFNIDQDAARQLSVSRQIADDAAALADCRATQLTDIDTRLASASNDKDRKAIRRERTQLIGALKQDVDVAGDVVDQHIGMSKTFTQGRAMTDGTSEAEVLGGQAPAYAPTPATTRLSMPKAATASQDGAPAQQVSAPASPMVTLKPTLVRAAPVASAAVVMNLPAGREVKPTTAQADGGWWEIDVAGVPGYIRAGDLGPPGSASAQVATKGKGKGKGPAAVAARPVVAGPSNIRAYNQSVIAARDSGKGRLSSLMTDIQTSQRRDATLWAMLSRWGLG